MKSDKKQESKKQKTEQVKYSVDDFAEMSNVLFKTPSECVYAAFKEKEITEATEDEAKEIVRNFMTKEVKS